MSKPDFLFILKSFLIWRIGILLVAALAIGIVPLFSNNFLGGGLQNYLSSPLLWGNLNFDGEHYLSIVRFGYQPLTYFYFPLFPFFTKILSFSNNLNTFVLTGLIVSNISFLFALVGIYKLVKMDFSEMVSKLTVILLLLFPTSFYFGAYYTESLFLFLVVWSFYFARQKNFLIASTMAAFASAARVIGIVMLPVLIIEYFTQKKKHYVTSNLLYTIFISPLGLLIYIFYLLRQTGDPLNFLNTVSIFGAQRSSTFILLPQVFYRYFFKILPNLSYSYFPNVFASYLEFLVASGFFVLSLIALFKLRPSYSIFALSSFLIPTLSGSFSSMPRYVLIIFPVFILSAKYLNKLPKVYQYVIFSVMLVLMIISTGMFWRGYWLS